MADLVLQLMAGNAGDMGAHGLAVVTTGFAALYFLAFWRNHTLAHRVRRVSKGIVCSAGGICIRSAYWWIWYLPVVQQDPQLRTGMLDWSFVLLPPFALTTYGYLILLEPLFDRFGRWRWPVAAAMALLTYILLSLPGLIEGV